MPHFRQHSSLHLIYITEARIQQTLLELFIRSLGSVYYKRYSKTENKIKSEKFWKHLINQFLLNMLEPSEISTSELIHSVLHKTIKNEIQSDNYKITLKSASQAGDSNFIGMVYRVYFEKEDENDNDRNSSSLILKVTPQNAARRNQFCSRSSFLREIYLYDKVLISNNQSKCL